MDSPRVNVADALSTAAAAAPDAVAVIASGGTSKHDGTDLIIDYEPETSWRDVWSSESFDYATFGYLDTQASLIAKGLLELGVRPGTRVALLVKPSIEFVTLVFALLRSGATMVLVDSGLGRKNIVRCLASTEPEGFVAIPLGHLLRIAKRREFPRARLNVNVGFSWLPLGTPLAGLARRGEQSTAELPHTTADDAAAIVFTSGSTGPPKGVVYRHETFATQLSEIQRMYGLEAGGVDLACFPLFGLFNVAMGITTVLPEMDFSRPAQADPEKLLAAANQHKVTQSFASPAVWDKLSRYCKETGESIPTLEKVFSCGAPVGAEVIERTLTHVAPGAELHTPYGATESLPVSTTEAQEILNETAEKTRHGAGVCVGRKVESIEWRIIKITDEPIATIDQTEELPQGEIGELIVQGPQVSKTYLTPSPQPKSRGVFSEQGEPTTPVAGYNQLAKIADGETIWHRMGDVGYLDEQHRFWYCGRKSQRVVTSEGTLYTECVEQVVNAGCDVFRSALVGVGRGDLSEPAVVFEDFHPWEGDSQAWAQVGQAIKALGLTSRINHVLRHKSLPVDIRHNAKINREQLAQWAAKKLKKER